MIKKELSSFYKKKRLNLYYIHVVFVVFGSECLKILN